MDLYAKEGIIPLKDTFMEYCCFGRGKRSIVMIPGMADGLWSAKGHGESFANLYPKFADNFTVYLFSRKNDMPEGYSSEDMMQDIMTAMDYFQIEKAHLLGHSQGAMIASLLAAKHPEKIERLFLIVPLARQNDSFHQIISRLRDLAIQSKRKELLDTLFHNYYTEATIQSLGGIEKVSELFGEPSPDLTRFVRCTEALLRFDAYDLLPSITAETIVLAGEKDQIVTFEGSVETAQRIPGAKLLSFAEYGHAVNEEMPNFSNLLYSFFT